jgi:hypothetical protein
MRRLVTGLSTSGQSTVVSVEEIEGMEVWEADTRETPPWMAGKGRILPFEPDQGWVKCMYVTMPPESADDRSENDTSGAEGPVKGLHRTRTIDVIYFLDPVILLLEDGDVPIDAGDVLVQRGTMHDFRNPGTGPARLLGFSWGVGDSNAGM